MVTKRCQEKGCPTAPRCAHPWYIRVKVRGKLERGPVSKYAHLLDRGQVLPVNKSEAKRLEAKVLAWVLQGRPAPVVETAAPSADDGPTIAAAGRRYLTQYVKPELAGNGDEGHVQHIIDACGDRRIADLLDRATLREFMALMRRTRGEVSANRHYSRWSHFANWCRVEFGLTGNSPFYHRRSNPQGIKKSEEGRRTRPPLSDEEEAALVRAAQARDDGGMMLGRLYCALDAGPRRGEMLALTKRDVLRNRQGLQLRFQWYVTKRRKERIVPVTSERLKAFLDSRRFAEFPFGDATGARVDSFRTEWEHILLAAGFAEGEQRDAVDKHGETVRRWVWTRESDLTWHDLRHDFATRLHDRNVPLRDIRDVLGHASIATTERYLNATSTGLADQMRRVHQSMGL